MYPSSRLLHNARPLAGSGTRAADGIAGNAINRRVKRSAAKSAFFLAADVARQLP